MIQVFNLSKIYSLGVAQVSAIKNIDLKIEKGEFVAIAGASGSGKSTLLNIIGAIEKPTGGRVEIEGTDLGRLSSNQLADLRAQRLGFVFQTFNLLPVMTAFENVEYPLQLGKMSKADRTKRVQTVLEEVGLSSFLHHRPDQLSGGQRQRVAIARALAANPIIICADEPTANLDHRTGTEIITLLKQLTEKHVTVIIATHDPAIIQQCQRVIELSDGRLAKSS